MESLRKIFLIATAATVMCASAAGQDTTATAETTTAPADTASTGTAAISGDMKVLELDLPKPVFVGTPKNIKVENLEPAGTKQEPLQVPKDVTNIAAEKRNNGKRRRTDHRRTGTDNRWRQGSQRRQLRGIWSGCTVGADRP